MRGRLFLVGVVVVVLPLHKAGFLSLPCEFHMRMRSGLCRVCVPLFVFASVSPHPSHLSFLSPFLPLLLSVRHRQTQAPPHFYLPCETPGLTHSSCFTNNRSLPPQSSPIFRLRFLLLLPVYILLCVCKIPFSSVFFSLNLFPHLP